MARNQPHLGFIRQAWVDASEFHSYSTDEIFRKIYEQIIEFRASTRPIVLLDLDSTLYEVEHRSHEILKEWLAHQESHAHPKLRAVLPALERVHLGYSLKDTFKALGLELSDLDVENGLNDAKRFWSERFFSSAYLHHDRPYNGAPEFVRELKKLGATLVYLTGRDAPGMEEGTRANLIRDGFPMNDENVHLLMKPNSAMDDLEFKTSVAEFIHRHGKLIASFENEPPNLVALFDLFPDAMHIFIETISSERPALPRKGLYKMKGFKG